MSRRWIIPRKKTNKKKERIKKILLLTTTKRFIKINPNQQREDDCKSFVDEKATDSLFDVQRITKACANEILRLNEATRDSTISRKIVDYLSDSCNRYGVNQIGIINKLPDSDFRKLFGITFDIVSEYPGTETLNNPKAFLSSEIGKCIEKYKQSS